MTFYDFLIRHFKKNVKSHVFWKSEKNEKYVFSNTAYMYTPHVVQHSLPTDAAGGSAMEDTGRRSRTSLSADAEYF